MSNTFSYVRYDEKAVRLQAKLKMTYEALEEMILDDLPEDQSGFEHKKDCLKHLEISYMYTGKSIRNDQIERTGKVDEQPERNAE